MPEAGIRISRHGVYVYASSRMYCLRIGVRHTNPRRTGLVGNCLYDGMSADVESKNEHKHYDAHMTSNYADWMVMYEELTGVTVMKLHAFCMSVR